VQAPAKKDPNAPVPTALEKLLAQDLNNPVRADGSDKFFGFENVSTG
jgi:ubiquitin carboxyl-terminal hydrolase 9/13